MKEHSELVQYLNLYRKGRRDFLGGAAASALALAAGPTLVRRAKAAEGTIRVMGIATFALEDWSQFEADTGLKMEFTQIDDTPGNFLHEVKANDAGDRYDIFAFLSGIFPFINEEHIIRPDSTRMPNWSGINEDVSNSQLLGGAEPWGIPLIFNADAFGYFPEVLNEPRPPGRVSWDLIFDSQKTMGRVGLDESIFMLMWAGFYLKAKGLAEIDDAANLTESECITAADYLIERKKAGQFRASWATFEEQVSFFVNREVDAAPCWEPGVRDARRQGADVEWATTHEGHAKWMISAFIPAQVKDRGNEEEVYRALDWFLGGAYSAEINVLRGYGSARPDLGIEYAREHGWSADKIEAIEAKLDDIKLKYAEPFNSGIPELLDIYERENSRFKRA